MLNVPITPPRVAFIDPRTGNVSREWYMFFLSIFGSVGGSNQSLTDLQKGPPSLTIDEINNLIDKANIALGPSNESTIELIAELRKQVEGLEVQVRPEMDTLSELRKQVEGLEVQVRPELGTLSQLQQDNVPWLQFDTTPSGMPTGVNANGTLYWDDADSIKTLNIVMEDSGEVIQHIGEETYYRVKASATITKGQVVMFTGTVGASGGLRGAPATGLTSTQSEYVMGVATQNIANNGWGYVTWFGEVKGVNTTGGAEAWVDGQILYYNPAVAGGLTKTVPTAPNPKVIVASVVHAATNGILFVRPTFGSALGATDSNVEITGLANGDLLQYDSGQQRWENVPASTLPVGTATNIAGGAAGSVPYQTAPGTTTFRAIGTAQQVMRVNLGATAPEWVPPAALTKTDDTNVTLTLGGDPSNALLAAASLTMGWTGQLSITRGGSGQSTAQAAMNTFAGALTSGYYLRGNGTDVVMSAIQAADVPTLNQNTTGSAATLTTPRTINGTSFNGSADITTASWGTTRSLWGQSVNGSADITSPLLPAAGSASAPAYSTSGDTNTGVYFPSADTVGITTNGTLRAQVNGFGDFLIGVSSFNTGYGFSFTNSGYWTVRRNSSNAGDGLVDFFSDWGAPGRNVFRVQSDGNVLNYNNSYGALSDASLKTNISDARDYLTDLRKVKIRKYQLIDSPEEAHLGVIAQEVEQVFPRLVTTNADGKKAVKYSIFVPMLIKAIQELADQVDNLTHRCSQSDSDTKGKT